MKLWPLIFVCLGTVAAKAEPVVVFAAASLQEPLDALAADQGDVVLSYGGSGALARQVLAGAPADVVVLAHPIWMDTLDAAGAILPDSRRDVAGNTLVLIGPAGAAPVALTAEALLDRLAGGRLAIGLTGAVPAGQYGQAALTHLNLWQALAPHLAEVDSVRAALLLVARGETPLGITYATDAAATDAVKVLATFPPDSHAPIRYPAAQVSDTPAARAFLDRLSGPAGQAALARAGFTP